MKKSTLIIFVILFRSLFVTEVYPKQQTGSYTISYIPVRTKIDTTYIAEYRISAIKSALDGAAMMYENYGKYSEHREGKHQPNIDRYVWRDVQLFEDSEERFLVIADGAENMEEYFSCFLVFDSKGRNCFGDTYPLKNKLMFLFADKIENVKDQTVKKIWLNTEFNGTYRKSRETFQGTYEMDEYQQLISKLEEELNVEIPEGKSVLINFAQNAPNCINRRNGYSEQLKIIERGLEISNRICKEQNVFEVFIYTSDAAYKQLYASKPEYKLDFGYFKETIFNIHENCTAFLAIKPNGKFMKHYGEDYYSKVESFLKKK